MCLKCLTRSDPDFDSDNLPRLGDDAGGVTSTGTGSTGKPFASTDVMAEYLTHGYWEDTGRGARSFDVQSGGTITVNLSGLTESAQHTAWQALDAWSAASGLNFVESASAQITFDDNNSGAYAYSGVYGSTISYSHVNIDAAWAKYGGYYLQTFIHEIGHALGLGHQGGYNGSASFGSDAEFANDSWQMSIMSYFSQSQNPNTDATRAYVATPQLADIAAIHSLYGVPTNVETGDTTYGDGQTTGRVGMDLKSWAVTIFDNGGVDHIDLSSRGTNQNLSLVEETFSDVNGKIGNVAIARGTVIENATTGHGADKITGNAADNVLDAGAGVDQINAGDGDDVLIGGAGADQLAGEGGADVFVYRSTAEGGDTIQDFNLAEGDQIDISAVLAEIGYTGDRPVGDGVVALKPGAGGSWLSVNQNGNWVQLALLVGIALDADLAAILGIEEPELDTVYSFDDNFIGGVMTDTDGGTDTLDLTAVTKKAQIWLSAGSAGTIGDADLHIASGAEIENLFLGQGDDQGHGTEFANVIHGNMGADLLCGYGGDDAIEGGLGNDRIYGGAGKDQLDGGDGHDRIYAEDGDDELTGGAGRDLLKGGAGDDLIFGGDGNDRIYGEDDNDILHGGAGNDAVYGGNGADQLFGEDGNDRLMGDRGADVIYGGAGMDQIKGGHDNDHLFGGEGNDRLWGDAGADVLNGGAGVDRIFGGGGADVFFFSSQLEIGDVIYDFSRAEGDRFDISGLMAALGTSTTQAVGSGALSLAQDGTAAWLEYSDATQVVQIAQLNNTDATTPLTSDWFVS